MDSEERKYWIAFSTFVGFGPKRFKLLKDYFGSAKKAWSVSEKELREVGLSEKLISSFLSHREHFSPEDYLKKMDEIGVGVITSNDVNYPKLLKQINDAPFLLYIKYPSFANRFHLRQDYGGQVGRAKQKSLQESLRLVNKPHNPGEEDIVTDKIYKLFSEPTLAVVGTRKVTSYGQEVTEKLVADLVFNGVTIVSGMARGVDSIAHRTAILNKGLTIAVLGSGLDIVYPPENNILYNNIIDNGAVVSEFPLGFHPQPWCFPVRDRIMSGLSLGVLVTEAASDSGSLITASHAGTQGREVFAVPGPITSPVCAGTSELLKKGAKLVTNVCDILEELKIRERKAQIESQNILPVNNKEKLIIDILFSGQLHINNIVVESKLPVSEIGSLLMVMEMKGLIKNYGNSIYGRK